MTTFHRHLSNCFDFASRVLGNVVAVETVLIAGGGFVTYQSEGGSANTWRKARFTSTLWWHRARTGQRTNIRRAVYFTRWHIHNYT